VDTSTGSTSVLAGDLECVRDGWVDLVRVDFFRPGALDSLVQSREQLRERLIWPTLQHGQGVVTVGSHRHTAHGVEDTHSDLAIGDQCGDVWEVRMDASACPVIVSQAGIALVGSTLAARFQGSSSSMRLMG
jgi:hypothetical protein